jgi:uncharacterized protein YjbJ (UPF0337 family)
MSWGKIDGPWKRATGKIKEEWGMLTDHDLTVIDGNKDQLIGKIQEKYGLAKEDAGKQVDEFARAYFPTGSGRG